MLCSTTTVDFDIYQWHEANMATNTIVGGVFCSDEQNVATKKLVNAVTWRSPTTAI
jgi:hypothetical protein